MTTHESGSQRANAESRSEAQLTAGTSPDSIPQFDPHVRGLYEAEEGAGRAMARAWLTHPRVRPIIEANRGGAELSVSPVAEHLGGQEAVTQLTATVLRLTAQWPDGTRAPDVLDPAHGWPVTDEARDVVRALLPQYLHVVARELAAAGVPLDPSYPLDLLVVGQLLLLDVWAGPDVDLTAALNVGGPTTFRADGGGTPQVRVGRTARASRNADRVLEHLRTAAGITPSVLRAPYAGGGTRAPGPQGRVRAARMVALAEVKGLFP